jgi:uncharacterized protein affecting Mg2+/Co2+ transport
VNSTGVISSNIYSITCDGTSNYFFINQINAANVENNESFFGGAKVRVRDNVCDLIRVYILTPTRITFKQINNPVQDEWYNLFGKINIIENANAGIYVLAQYPDATTANGKIMEINGNAGVFAINMTALGIEDYTEAEMLKIVQTVGYFEGEYKMTRKEAFDVTMALIAENRAAIIALGGSI